MTSASKNTFSSFSQSKKGDIVNRDRSIVSAYLVITRNTAFLMLLIVGE
jgi:hypothetical protein